MSKSLEYSEEFEQFWKQYPIRKGDNPKKVAFKAWQKALLKICPPKLLEAVERFHRVSTEKIGTEFIPMASTWLNQCRFEGYLTEPEFSPLKDSPTDWDWICRMYVKTGAWYHRSPAPTFAGCPCPVEVLAAHGLRVRRHAKSQSA